jgi:hypothetical protein
MSQAAATVRVPARPVGRPITRERLPAPRLRVVAPVTHRPATGLALLCVALLGGGLLALLLLNISLGKGAYVLTELQGQQRRLAENQQQLAEQVEARSAPQQLASSARKLGMVPAPNPAFVRLPNGKVEGQPAVAQAPPKPRPSSSAASAAGQQAATGKRATTGKQAGTGKPPAGKPNAVEQKR